MFSPEGARPRFHHRAQSRDLAGYGADANGAAPAAEAGSPLALVDFPASWLRAQARHDRLGRVRRLRRRSASAVWTCTAARRRASPLRLPGRERDRALRRPSPPSRRAMRRRRSGAALDLAMLEKVLPKFHGTQQELEPVLAAALRLRHPWRRGATRRPRPTNCSRAGGLGQAAALVAQTGRRCQPTPALPRTAAKLWRMLRRLRQQGFTSFIE